MEPGKAQELAAILKANRPYWAMAAGFGLGVFYILGPNTESALLGVGMSLPVAYKVFGEVRKKFGLSSNAEARALLGEYQKQRHGILGNTWVVLIATVVISLTLKHFGWINLSPSPARGIASEASVSAPAPAND